MPALLVLAVALIYEGAARVGLAVPAFTWAPWGAVVAAVVLAAAAIGRLTIASTGPASDPRAATTVAARRLASATAVVLIVAGALVLTVAPREPHGPLANTVYDPPPAYAKALGGNDTIFEAKYTVLSELPRFVGHPAYRGEVLLTWEPRGQFGDLLGPMGIYHNAFTWVSKSFPVLNRAGVQEIRGVRAAQVLLMSLTGRHFAQAVRSLASLPARRRPPRDPERRALSPPRVAGRPPALPPWNFAPTDAVIDHRFDRIDRATDRNEPPRRCEPNAPFHGPPILSWPDRSTRNRSAEAHVLAHGA